MTFNEIIAVVFSLICVILTIRRSIWCWPTGIVGVLFYGLVFYDAKLYSDMVLQGFYLLQCIYGMEKWMQSGIDTKKKFIKTERLSLAPAISHVGASILLWLLLYQLMTTYTDASLSMIDAALSVLSIIANYYLAKRILESWFIWIVVDVAYVGVFMYKGLYLSSGLYALFFVMAIYGLLEWKKTLNIKTGL